MGATATLPGSDGRGTDADVGIERGGKEGRKGRLDAEAEDEAQEREDADERRKRENMPRKRMRRTCRGRRREEDRGNRRRGEE